MKVTTVYLVCILTLSLCTWNLVQTMDLRKPYFSDVQIVCNENSNTDRNSTEDFHSPSKVTWLLPNGHVINNNNQWNDVSRIQMTIVNNTSILKVKRINDDDFGIYWCFYIKNGSEVAVFKHSLNIDGAPTDDYTQNAIFGAISGGVVLIVCLVVYIIWYCRCSDRVRRKQNIVENLEKGIHQYDTKFYDNIGLELYSKKSQRDKY